MYTASSSAGTAILFAVAVWLTVLAADGQTHIYRLGDWPAPFGIVLVLDRLSALMVLLTSVLALIVLWRLPAWWMGLGTRDWYEGRADLQLALAAQMGINVVSLDEARWLDLTIDGADEVDPEWNLIKGGGAAMLIEKVVAHASDRYCIILGSSKLSSRLGEKAPVPVEVVPSLAGRIAQTAGVKLLVLTHFYPDCEDADIENQCRSTYNGKLVLAQDLMTFGL